MNRRRSLSGSAVISGEEALKHLPLHCKEPLINEEVDEVHVIFKTHLDIGFTDMAAKVKEIYFDRFIPNVLALRERLAEEGREDRYQWSTGSWLVCTYLESASPARGEQTGGKYGECTRRRS